jgi:hypothetical protein
MGRAVHLIRQPQLTRFKAFSAAIAKCPGKENNGLSFSQTIGGTPHGFFPLTRNAKWSIFIAYI